MINSEDQLENFRNISRRHFLRESAAGLGVAALGAMLGSCNTGNHASNVNLVTDPMAPRPAHFPGKAKRVI